ncbi:unnamed protein product [Cercopithifilaria johnstoni]|uniref:Secreted protein n=1 Tax=Cercopithifilaria johnstoni TaxID=2874296 RepID=A0A8J2MDR0_9BILA|nr:unnamed protein product [Cercopithifilaria johnstoni]
MVVLVGPCFFAFPFGWAGLSIGDQHLSPRRPTARPPTSFQTFHFAECHEPPQNESHGKTEEGRRDSDSTVYAATVIRNPNTIKRSLNKCSTKSASFLLYFPSVFHSCP